MTGKIKFKVFDAIGKDVTKERNWLIDVNGELYFETNDIDCPIMDVENNHYYVVEPNTANSDLNKKLKEIGNNVASLWGGSCYEVQIETKEQKVIFICIEHGEEFITEMTFEEIKEEYGLDLTD